MAGTEEKTPKFGLKAIENAEVRVIGASVEIDLGESGLTLKRLPEGKLVLGIKRKPGMMFQNTSKMFIGLATASDKLEKKARAEGLK